MGQVWSLRRAVYYGTSFVAKLYSLQWEIAILNPTWFFTESNQFFCTTKSVFHWTWLNCFTEPTRLFYRTDLVFCWTESVFQWIKLGFFCIIKWGVYPQPAIVSCKRTRSFTHAKLLRMQSHQDVAHDTDISDTVCFATQFYCG